MTHKLLLADDSVTIQRVIELTFADEDVQVIVAGDGRQAIERIQADRPDIVLADVGMPERDGYEVAAFIKQHPQLADIPVLLLTGAFEPLDEDRARSVGCDGVLIKPFEPQVVISRVKELLAERARPVPAGGPRAHPVDAGAGRPAGEAGDAGDRDQLDDYFDRLDAAFASFGAAKADGPAGVEPPLAGGPGLDGLTSAEPAVSRDSALEAWDPERPGGVPGEQAQLASAFAALLAAEQGLTAAPASAPPALPPTPALTDELIDEIAARVAARMADDSMRRLVVETAERLVRQEIERIKRMSGAAPTRPAG